MTRDFVRPALLARVAAAAVVLLSACAPSPDSHRPVFFVDESASRAAYTLGDDTRQAVSTPTVEPVSFTVDVPGSPELRFSVAASTAGPLAAPVTFRMRVDGEEVFEAVVRRAEPNRWHPKKLDLSAYAGHTVVISLEASSPDAAALPLWGNPVLVDRTWLPATPNIVLISIDCLRADHLSAYGYGRQTSPHIDAFARDAVVFSRASATSSYTLPTHASMLTGLPPSFHGATARRRISRAVAYAPELLTRAGYRADAIVSAPFLSPIYGFHRGFHTYRLVSSRAERLVDQAIELLSAGEGTSQFLLLHLFDVHMPYTPPREFRSRFGEPSEDLTDLIDHVTAREPPESDQQIRDLVSLYDGEIAYVDREVGRFLDYLRDSHLYERTLVVLTADHGEGFYEHGAWEHARPWHVGPGLYQEVLHVPLIVKWPGGRPGVISEAVSQTDIFPTILSAAGVAQTTAWARDLSEEDASSPPRPIVSEFVGQGEDPVHLYALREGGFKFIFDGTYAQLYDLVNDPGERINLIDVEPEMAARFRAKLEDYRGHAATVDLGDSDIVLPDKVRERLRALGYVER